MTMGLIPDDYWKMNQEKYGELDLWHAFGEDNCETLTQKIRTTINVLKAQDIRGCITGSTLLDEDFDLWDSIPDIDVFVYSSAEMLHTCAVLEYRLGMTPGKGSERSNKQEVWKLERLRKSGPSRKLPVDTHSFYFDGVIVNVTIKSHHNRPYDSIHEILGSFDMSIIMKGYDIHRHFWLDLRFGDPRIAYPNIMRDMDCVMWNVAKWTRQFDRVVKYYNRGYDTRPMAEFYLKMIDECIEAGCLFDSEASQDAYNSFTEEFSKKRQVIAEWLKEHKED